MEKSEVDKYARILWDYHHLHQKPQKVDILMCFTSLDLTVPKYASELMKKGYAPRMLISGGNAHNKWIPDDENIQKTDRGTDSEAEKYHEIAIEEGVPEDKIILETKSTNSGENVTFSYEILKNLNQIPKKVMIVHKPTMERRAYAAFMNYWPDENVDLTVVSQPYTYEEYVGKVIDREVIINIMVGDLQRIIIYPGMGFQIHQNIPVEVMDAYDQLIKLGYTKHLNKD